VPGGPAEHGGEGVLDVGAPRRPHALRVVLTNTHVCPLLVGMRPAAALSR
jgi:hypothetical protein